MEKVEKVVEREMNYLASSLSSIISEEDWDFFNDVLLEVEKNLIEKLKEVRRDDSTREKTNKKAA